MTRDTSERELHDLNWRTLYAGTPIQAPVQWSQSIQEAQPRQTRAAFSTSSGMLR